MNPLILWLVNILEKLGPLAYVVLAIIVVFEALPIIGWLIPGVVIMIFIGFTVAWGIFNLSQVLIIFSASVLVGDLISFIIGKRLKYSSNIKHNFLKPEYLERAENFIQRWGIFGIIIGRFFGPLRSLINIVAGTTKMSWWRFIILSSLGSSLFVIFYVGLGYIAASAWQTVSSWSSRAGLVLVIFIVTLLLLWWLKGFLVRQGKELRALIVVAIKSGFDKLIHSLFWHWLRKKSFLLTNIFERRFSPHRFRGLSLLSLVLSIVICLVFIWWLGVAGLNPDSFWFGFDERIRSLVILFSDTRLAIIAFLVTVFGSTEFISVAGLFLSFWLILEHRRSQVVGLWVAVLGTAFSGTILKFIFAKPRPDPTFYFENFYAFPSLHAALAMAFLMYFVYYAIKAYPRWSRNVSLVLASSFIIITIGFSRIYLGVHYPSDVIGGWLIGLAWFIIGVISQRFFASKENPRRLSKRFKIWAIASIILLLFSFYINQAFSKGSLKDFYYSLPSIIENRDNINLEKINNWPPFTENWRGGRWRPLSVLVIAEDARLKDSLIKAGWEERNRPDLSNVIGAGLNTLLKKDNIHSPIRPRFWHNNSNELAFVKSVIKENNTYEYSARLWKVQTTDNQSAYVVELLMTKNFILDFKSVNSERINEVQKAFIKDLSLDSNFKEINKINYYFKNEEQIEEKNNGFEVTLYVVSL